MCSKNKRGHFTLQLICEERKTALKQKASVCLSVHNSVCLSFDFSKHRSFNWCYSWWAYCSRWEVQVFQIYGTYLSVKPFYGHKYLQRWPTRNTHTLYVLLWVFLVSGSGVLELFCCLDRRDWSMLHSSCRIADLEVFTHSSSSLLIQAKNSLVVIFAMAVLL